ncbi:hypothetical protein ACLBXI_14565 [Bacillus cereus]
MLDPIVAGSFVLSRPQSYVDFLNGRFSIVVFQFQKHLHQASSSVIHIAHSSLR